MWPLLLSITLASASAAYQSGPTAERAVHPPLPPSSEEVRAAVPPGPGAALGVLGRVDAPLIDSRTNQPPRAHWSHWWVTERPTTVALLVGSDLLPEQAEGAYEVVRLLTIQIKRSGNPGMRRTIAHAIGRAARSLEPGQRESALDVLTSLLVDDAEPVEVRAAGAFGLGVMGDRRAIETLLGAMAGDAPPALHRRVALALGIASVEHDGSAALQQRIALSLARACERAAGQQDHGAALAALGLVALAERPSLPAVELRADPLATVVTSRAALASWARKHIEKGLGAAGKDPAVRAIGLATLGRLSRRAGGGSRETALGILGGIASPDSQEDESSRAAALLSIACFEPSEKLPRGVHEALGAGPPLTRGLAALAMGRWAPTRSGFTGPQRTWAALGRATGSQSSGSLRGAVDPGEWTAGADVALGLGLAETRPWWTQEAAAKRARGEVAGSHGLPAAGHAALALALLEGTQSAALLDGLMRTAWRDPATLYGSGLGLMVAGVDGLGGPWLKWLAESPPAPVDAVLGELLGSGPGARLRSDLMLLARATPPNSGAIVALGRLTGGEERWRRLLWRGHPYFVTLDCLRGGDAAGPGVLDTR